MLKIDDEIPVAVVVKPSPWLPWTIGAHALATMYSAGVFIAFVALDYRTIWVVSLMVMLLWTLKTVLILTNRLTACWSVLNLVTIVLCFWLTVFYYFVSLQNTQMCGQSPCTHVPFVDAIYNPQGVFPTVQGDTSFRDNVILCPSYACRWAPDDVLRSIQGYASLIESTAVPNISAPLPVGGLATTRPVDYPPSKGLRHGFFLGVTVFDTIQCPGVIPGGAGRLVCPKCRGNLPGYSHCSPEYVDNPWCVLCPARQEQELHTTWILFCVFTIFGLGLSCLA
jgi:hypothetical protein